MSHLNIPIAYLENEDFDHNGNLINDNIPKNIPVVIMTQADFCSHCVDAKQDFQQFANQQIHNVFCATISQGSSSNKSEQELISRIRQINPSFRGFPDYMLYYNGKRVNKNIQDRSVQGLVDFVK